MIYLLSYAICSANVPHSGVESRAWGSRLQLCDGVGQLLRLRLQSWTFQETCTVVQPVLFMALLTWWECAA